MKGEIRVGRTKYINRRTILPKYPGYTEILVLTKTASRWGGLGPYHLKNNDGQILENVWQFSKCYKNVPGVTIPYSTGNPKIVWEWPSQTHIDENSNFTEDFWKWRLTGKNNQEPVRNPVGWKHLKNCLFSLEHDEPISENNPKLGYIDSRKKIYLPIYMEAVIREPEFWELYSRLQQGENLLIQEVDGPHQESLNYYQNKYGVEDNFIVQDSVQANERNLAILLNDEKHPFGHGYCLAWSLMQDYQF